MDIYTPRTMGKVVRRLAPVHTFFRDTFFKRRRTFNSEAVDVDFVKNGREVAGYVHPRLGGEDTPSTGYATKTYTPPMLAPYNVTTADQLMKRMPGEDPYSGRAPADRGLEKMANELVLLRNRIVRREELMSTQAIFMGEIPIIGKGLKEVISFGFTNKATLTGKKKWSDPDSDPINDLTEWHRAVQENGYVNCDTCVMAHDVVNAFIGHEKVQKVLDVKNIHLAVIEPKMLPKGVTYIGHIPRLNLSIYEYNEWYTDNWTDPEKPINMPMVPDGTVALLSTDADYEMLYGAATFIDQATREWVTVEGDLVPHSWVENNPSRKMIQLMSRPLPVPHEVDSWFVAKVL